jgi:hypothetical protein
MKKIVVILFAGLLVSAGLQAQKVSKDASNRVILDLTVAAGMPAGAITDVSKTARFNELMADPVVGAPSATNKLWHSENQHNGAINATVFEKLEVAPKNMNKVGVIGGTGTMTMDWVEAFNGCIKSGWRLPTQRELMLMCIFKEALDAAFPSDGALSFANYWGATENTASTACIVHVGYGDTYRKDKNLSTYVVRCVREVTTTP